LKCHPVLPVGQANLALATSVYDAHRQASEFKGSKGFGGLAGLLGTGVTRVAATQTPFLFVVKKQKQLAMLSREPPLVREYQIIRKIRRIRSNLRTQMPGEARLFFSSF
jgi:hypothetical protein